MKRTSKFVVLGLSVLLPSVMIADTFSIPAGTVVYGQLDERVTSRKKETSEGDLVNAHVWKDVVVNGRTVVRAGEPMIVRVSRVKKSNFAGIKGKLELEAVSVQLSDGTEIPLSGGYDKSGKGKKALAISLAALVAWPLIFIKGKQAVLDTGTVFDANVRANVQLAADVRGPTKIRLARGLEVEVLYEQMETEGKIKLLPVGVRNCGAGLGTAAVITVNEKKVAGIPVTLGPVVVTEGCAVANGDIDLEILAKHFSKGINRFEVGAGDATAEVILDIEM